MIDLFDLELWADVPLGGGFDMDALRHLEKRYNEQLTNKIARFSQIFELTGGTSTIPNWRLKQFLLLRGIGAFAVYPRDGKLYFLTGNLGGINDNNYLPTKFVFANPHMPDGLTWSGQLDVKDECVVAKNDSTYSGILPIIRKHTITQVHTDLSFYLAIISTRLTTLTVAGRDPEAAAFNLMIEDVERGNLSAVVDKNVLQQLKTLPYGGNGGIIKEYIEFMQYDKAAECNELGLSANWNAKRESIAKAETLLNDDATHPFVDNMFATWQEWIKAVNEKYGDKLDNGEYKLDWASAWKQNEKEQEILMADSAEKSGENAAEIEDNDGGGVDASAD